MPTTPYAKLLLTLNAGATTSGGVVASVGNVVQLSGESTVGWTQQRYEISDYPLTFACPSGWSTDTNGVYFYAASAVPPPFTLPAAWGKFMLSLVVNNGINGSGHIDFTLTDTSTALSVLSPTLGLHDLGFGETTQYNALKLWIGDLRANYRLIDTALAGAVLALSSTTPAAVGTAGSVGTGTTAARADHVHALPFTPVQAALGAASGAVGINDQNLTGVGASFAFSSLASGPTIAQPIIAGFGATTGNDLTVVAQPGQAQTGGAANNNGGSLVLHGGLAGTGGGGAAGVQGSVQIVGGDVVVQAGATTGTLQIEGLGSGGIVMTGGTVFVNDVKFGAKTGFNNTAPIAKPTVTGAKGGNAALGSLLTALANYGLVIDSTSA